LLWFYYNPDRLGSVAGVVHTIKAQPPQMPDSFRETYNNGTVRVLEPVYDKHNLTKRINPTPA